MEEKNKIKISLTSFIVFTILIAIIAVLVTYIVINNNNEEINRNTDIKNQLSENKPQEEKENNNKNEQPENLNINSALVQKLYKYVLKSEYYDFPFGGEFAWQNDEKISYYHDTKTTFGTLSDMEKILAILSNYDESEIKEIDKSEIDSFIDTTYYIENRTVMKFDNVLAKAQKIFNESNYNFNSYDGCAARLDYYNNCYYIADAVGGGGAGGPVKDGYAKIQKAERQGDYFYIYDKYMYIDAINYFNMEGDEKIHVYTSADETKEIGTEYTYSFVFEDLFKKYESKLNTYKHTFKKADDGSYYWVSTEVNN